MLRWAAPAGAIAAGLLLLIGLRESRRPAAQSTREPVQVAENRPETPRSESESNALRDVEKQKDDLRTRKDLEQLQTKAPETAPPAARDEKKSSVTATMPPLAGKPEKRDKSPALTSRLYREYYPDRPHGFAKGPSAAAGQAQAADRIQNAAPSLVGQANQSVEVTAPAPELDADKQVLGKAAAVGGAAAAASAPAPPPPAPARAKGQVQSDARESAADTQLITRAQSVEVSSYKGAVNKIGLDIRIAAPGGKKIWSVGPNGQILFSKDAGRSWLAQSSGVSTNLTGGSAPSDKVCWIAGATGTLLRTTDSGNHWQVVRTPISGDLGGVHAADAHHASIWDAPNHLSYETSDGGATWKQTANE